MWVPHVMVFPLPTVYLTTVRGAMPGGLIEMLRRCNVEVRDAQRPGGAVNVFLKFMQLLIPACKR